MEVTSDQIQSKSQLKKQKQKQKQIADMIQSFENDPKMNQFKKMEKKYKYYQGFNSDLSEVLDFNKPQQIDFQAHKISQISIKNRQVFKINNPEGCYLIKNFVPVPDQLYLAQLCLNKFSKKPFRTNLFIYENDQQNQKSESQNQQQDQLYKSQEDDDINNYQFINTLQKTQINDYQRFCFNKKIRWANVGYQYDWNIRNYPKGKTQIPEELEKLSKSVIEFMSEEIHNIENYYPESTIINFYDEKDTMGGHLDDGEPDQMHPIFSFQFGLSCIFLIGGKTKDEKPIALRLDSGDLFIMSKAARQAYHGVPRILANSFDLQQFQDDLRDNEVYLKDMEEYENNIQKNPQPDSKVEFENNLVHVLNYLKENRINLNFRQVFLN